MEQEQLRNTKKLNAANNHVSSKETDNASKTSLMKISVMPSLPLQDYTQKTDSFNLQLLEDQQQQLSQQSESNMSNHSTAQAGAGFTHRATENNASKSKGVTRTSSSFSSKTKESFIGSSHASVNPVYTASSSLPPSSSAHTNLVALGDDDEGQLIDTSTQISSEIVNDRIKTTCGELPKNITKGVPLSTQEARVLFANLSASRGDSTGFRSSTNSEVILSNRKRTRENNRHSRALSKKKSSKIFTALAPLLTEQMGYQPQMGKTKKDTVVGLKLASENGLVFKSQLQDKEYVFLNAAEFGEVEIVRDLLNDPTLNVNCVDYMGRNAVLLAMKTENIELIDALVGKLNFYAVEDALLNAISQEKIHIVKLIIDHPQYIRMEKIMAPRGQRAGLVGKGIERSQFSADITPLMLAAHTNNHEIIQLLLDRGLKVEMPHDRSCICLDCESIRAQVSHHFHNIQGRFGLLDNNLGSDFTLYIFH